MLDTVSIATLREEVYELLDVTSAGSSVNAKTNLLIKRKLSKAYNLLVSLDESYFVTTCTLTLTTESINLSSALATTVSMMKIVRLFYKDSDETYELDEMKIGDYGIEVHNTTTVDAKSLKWMLRGNRLVFNGAPGSSTTLYLWYIPVWNDDCASTAAITWKLPFNWTDLVVYGVCADMRERSEEDPRYFEQKYQEAKADIMNEAMNRSLASDACVWDKFNRWG